MYLEVQILEGPLGPARDMPAHGGGAVLCFEGIVRSTENGKPIQGLMYESYQPMAQRQIEKIAGELLRTHGLLAMRIEHSTGWTPIGKISFRLQIASMHRQEALAAAHEFIERLKKDVPIWKKAES